MTLLQKMIRTALVLIFSAGIFVVVSCGGTDPKTLAQEYVEVIKEFEKSAFSDNNADAQVIEEKLKAIEKQKDTLKGKNKEAFDAELKRLQADESSDIEAETEAAAEDEAAEGSQ